MLADVNADHSRFTYVSARSLWYGLDRTSLDFGLKHEQMQLLGKAIATHQIGQREIHSGSPSAIFRAGIGQGRTVFKLGEEARRTSAGYGDSDLPRWFAWLIGFLLADRYTSGKYIVKGNLGVQRSKSRR